MMRHDPTPAEARLWMAIRGRQLDGLYFRRQHPLGRFILDFCCTAHRLVIEVDGPLHAEREAYDAARTESLTQFGYRVIRFSNQAVLDQLPDVLQRIREASVLVGAGSSTATLHDHTVPE